ncbi:hypothetical protein [Xaviernesmea oryzae]|nr:hypothetical protein [Xaviernesmea oryzae]SEK64320.1 hypothetical protein SAMN04487976_103183 [Xaviernesmea oryzae]
MKSFIMHRAQTHSGEAAVVYKHYFIERPCRILIITDHLSARTFYRAVLRHISLCGAMLDMSPAIPLPTQFFLQIDGFEEELGCNAILRTGVNLGVRFNTLLPQAFLSRLIRVDFRGT